MGKRRSRRRPCELTPKSGSPQKYSLIQRAWGRGGPNVSPHIQHYILSTASNFSLAIRRAFSVRRVISSSVSVWSAAR